MSTLPLSRETLYFENTAGKLFHNPAGYVRLAWSPERTTFETVKAFYEQVLTLLLNSSAHKILSDHGQRVPLPGVAQQWLIEEWIPRAISQARTRHCAIVEGTNPLHRLSTQSVVATSPAGLIFQRFATVEAAHAWLKEVAP